MFVRENKKSLKTSCWLDKITKGSREFPVIDTIILIYEAVVLFFQILFQISPVMTFLAKTPLYDIQTYLGLLGGMLIVLDLFTTKKIWRGKFCLLLYAILGLAAVASIRMISYGLKENIFKLCWAAIQFVLVYSCAYRADRNKLKKYLKWLFSGLLQIWVVACCVSVYQYVNQIGYMYVVNPLAKDSSATRQGFYDNRLFGIFYTLNHAAIISTIFFMIALVWLLQTKKRVSKILLMLAAVPLLCYIILSNSRSAALILLVCMACLVWFLVRNKISKEGFTKTVVPIVCAVLALGCCVVAYCGLRTGLTRILYLNAKFEAYQEQKEEESAAEAPIIEYDEDVLNRKHLENDYSNGRFAIWKDYAALYREIGPIGMSPGNYMGYILENHPELYIVEYIRQHYPDKYESGIIYHVHSGYVMVYVSTGWVGAACLLTFIALCLVALFRKVYKTPVLSKWFIGTFLVVAIVAISAVFDEGIFFQNNPQTTAFWLCLGILMKECGQHCEKKQKILKVM